MADPTKKRRSVLPNTGGPGQRSLLDFLSYTGSGLAAVKRQRNTKAEEEEEDDDILAHVRRLGGKQSKEDAAEEALVTSGKRARHFTEESSERPRRQRFNPGEGHADDDPFRLYERYVRPQKFTHPTALSEIRSGMKRSCWLWFTLPTAPYVLNGIERGSEINRRYALRGGDATVRAYLGFERDGVNLRANYVAVARAVREQLEEGNTISALFGSMDEPKAISSFQLFERVAGDMGDEGLRSVCADVVRLAGVECDAKSACVPAEDELEFDEIIEAETRPTRRRAGLQVKYGRSGGRTRTTKRKRKRKRTRMGTKRNDAEKRELRNVLDRSKLFCRDRRKKVAGVGVEEN